MMLGWLPFPALTGQSMLLVLAAVLVAVLVSIAYGAGTSRPSASSVVVTVRGPEDRPAYIRLADPDAPSCHRPRAPGLRSPAA